MITKIGILEYTKAHIKPGMPGYNPDTSHYDREGNWVGDVSATKAGEYWKARADAVRKLKSQNNKAK